MPYFIRLAFAMQLEWLHLSCQATQKMIEASLSWQDGLLKTEKPAMLPVPIKRQD